MPATPSSLVAHIAQRLGRHDQPTAPELGLVAHLATVPDPRDRRGVRHGLASLLSVAVCAVLAGAKSLTAIGEWAAEAPGEVLARLGVRTDPLTAAICAPDESTVRKVLADIDSDALETSPSASSNTTTPPTSPKPYATTPATPADPSPSSASHPETDIPTLRRGRACPAPRSHRQLMPLIDGALATGVTRRSSRPAREARRVMWDGLAEDALGEFAWCTGPRQMSMS